MIPDDGVAGDFDETLFFSVPQGDGVGTPFCGGVVQVFVEVGQSMTLDRRASPALALRRSGREDVGVETRAGHHANLEADSREELDRRESAVRDYDDASTGQPTVDLQGGLASPVDQGFGGARLVGVEAG